MNIDWMNFSPYSALAGGLLIGLGAALMLLLNGRVAGISGIAGSLLQRPRGGDFGWRIAFLAGIVAAPLLYSLVALLPEGRIDTGWGPLILSGLLVGYGTRLGSGCSSGHGVCGLSRLSGRSLVATLTFMGAAFLSFFVTRHLFA